MPKVLYDLIFLLFFVQVSSFLKKCENNTDGNSIKFHPRGVDGLISDFYVPGTLLAGPDLSQIYPAEIFSLDKSETMFRKANLTETTSEVLAINTTTTEPTPKGHQCSGTKFLECSACSKYAVSERMFEYKNHTYITMMMKQMIF